MIMNDPLFKYSSQNDTTLVFYPVDGIDYPRNLIKKKTTVAK